MVQVAKSPLIVALAFWLNHFYACPPPPTSPIEGRARRSYFIKDEYIPGSFEYREADVHESRGRSRAILISSNRSVQLKKETRR